MKKFDLKLLLLCLCILTLPLHAQGDDEQPQKKEDSMLNIAKEIGGNALLAYMGAWLYLICHESGHAITNKLCTGDKIKIHLGVFPDSDKQAIIKTEHVNIYGFNPLGGYAVCTEGETKFQELLVGIAGGIFGAVQSYFLLAGVAGYHKYHECKNVKESFWYGLKNALFPFKNVMCNKTLTKSELYSHLTLMATCLIFNLRVIISSFLPSSGSVAQLVPKLDSRTDGTGAWTIMGTSENTQKVISVAAWLAEWILRFVIVGKAVQCAKRYEKKYY